MAHVTDRRSFLKYALAGAGLIAAPNVLAACGGASTTTSSNGPTSGAPEGIDAKWPDITSKQVVLAGFGGETYDVRRSLIFNSYTKLSGAEVVEAPWDYGKFLNMVAAKNPEWDMIDFDGYSVVGLVEAGTPPAKLASWVRRCDLVDAAYQDYCAGSYAYSVVLGWSSDLDTAPTNWADFFDTSKFPGKRAFPKSIYAGTVELALLADGVAPDQLYPLDFDRGFAKLDTIKKDLLFYDSYAQGQQYMAQQSVSMIATANSRMIQDKAKGVGDFTYEQAILYPWGGFPITQNAPDMDAANALVDYMSDSSIQAAVARELYLGPIVSAAFDELTDDELALQPNSDENRAKAAVVDTKAAAQADAEYVKRFFSWVGQ
ncbi:MAG TPA: extracellular solute-binding protein [Nocardioidaceae bacterium]|jgi:putative spermidine/putrescine transport system substrate-binding protein